MITNITWSDYLITIIILLGVYYIVIGIRYFSRDIQEILSGKRKLRLGASVRSNASPSYSVEEQQNDQVVHGFEATSDDEFMIVEALTERLKTAIEEASLRKFIPQEFRQLLCSILKDYASVKYSPLRSSVNELIVSECQKYEGVTLNIEDVELLWADVG